MTAAVEALAASAASACASGLVSLSTTRTQQVASVELDSKKSRFHKMSRSIMKGAALHALKFNQAIMLTATYRKDAEPRKEDISKALHAARQWATRQKITLRYVWAAELTKKGKLHYHVLFFLPPGKKLPMFDARGWWPHGMTRVEWARSGPAYIAKYASKGGGEGRAQIPKGFRIHGTGGLQGFEKTERRYHLAPQWVRNVFTLDERPKYINGIGWLSQTTGHIQESPYFVASIKGTRITVGIHQWYQDFLIQSVFPSIQHTRFF